tara:strand:+ start:8564 stop:8932 length:369 start_codon:yes stop_codon:yes gene_type:complete
MSNDKRKWVPEICYEDYNEENLTGGLPFIAIPKEKEMPNILFFFGSTDTGEFEPDAEGNEQPIVEMELYQFACMKYLQEGLKPEVYDQVRQCLGLLALEEARKRGKEQSIKIATNVQQKNTN